jgi:hypothetical protein
MIDTLARHARRDEKGYDKKRRCTSEHRGSERKGLLKRAPPGCDQRPQSRRQLFKPKEDEVPRNEGDSDGSGGRDRTDDLGAMNPIQESRISRI